LQTDISLIDVVQKKLDEGNITLPVLNPVAMDLRMMLADDSYDPADAAELIEQDPALASQILKMSNSAFFAGLRNVATVREAIVRVGSQKVVDLVTAVAHQANFRSSNAQVASYMKRLWEHAICCAGSARWIAQKTGHSNVAAEVFLGGMFHDIGELLLIKVLEEIQQESTDRILGTETLVLEVMDALHANLGHDLLEQWNIPEQYCSVARDHHDTSIPVSRGFAMVRLADNVCDKLGVSLHPDETISLSSTPEAELLGLSEIQLAELEIHTEDAMSEFGVLPA